MTEMHERELDIPPKSRIPGWILVLVGGVMIAIAVHHYVDRAEYLKKTRVKHRPPHTASAPATKLDSARNQMKEKSKPLVYWTLLAVGASFAMILIITVSRRIAVHVKNLGDGKRRKTPYRDPWKESADRIEVPPPSDDPDDPTPPASSN